MNRLTREIFVERTQDLLLSGSGRDVSLSEVLSACDANKGSLYHFFPSGKEELVLAAMNRQAECALASNRSFIANSKSTSDAVSQLVKSLTAMLEREDCPRFMPFAATGAIYEGMEQQIGQVCAQTLESLQQLYSQSLRNEGVATRLAKSLGVMIVSSIEGALLQSRTRGTVLPLKSAGIHLRELIDSHTESS
ncbi:MAG: TetR/AcrR family transcriptional regulator [Planctomycetota bacterium]